MAKISELCSVRKKLLQDIQYIYASGLCAFLCVLRQSSVRMSNVICCSSIRPQAGECVSRPLAGRNVFKLVATNTGTVLYVGALSEKRQGGTCTNISTV